MFTPMAHPVPLTGTYCGYGVDMPAHQSKPLLPDEAWTQAALYWNDPNQQFRKLFGYTVRFGIAIPIVGFAFFIVMISIGVVGLGTAVFFVGFLGGFGAVLYMQHKLRIDATREANEMSVRFFQPHGYRVEFTAIRRRRRHQMFLLIFRLDGQPIDPAQVPDNVVLAQPQAYPQPYGYGPTPVPGSAPMVQPPGAYGYPHGQPQVQVPPGAAQGMAYPGQAYPNGAPQQPPAQHYYAGPSPMGPQQGVPPGQPYPPATSGGYAGHSMAYQQGQYQGSPQPQPQPQQQHPHQYPYSSPMYPGSQPQAPFQAGQPQPIYSQVPPANAPAAGPTVSGPGVSGSDGAPVVGGTSSGGYPLAPPSTTGYSNPKGESSDVKAM